MPTTEMALHPADSVTTYQRLDAPDEPALLAMIGELLRQPGHHPVTITELVCHTDTPAPRPAVPAPAARVARPPAGPRDDGWETLTEREAGIALLVGEGLTNRQIATRLYLSPHTVNYHLRQVFRKLSISSRVLLSQLARAHA